MEELEEEIQIDSDEEIKPPKGFVLDSPQSTIKPPKGFVLDSDKESTIDEPIPLGEGGKVTTPKIVEAEKNLVNTDKDNRDFYKKLSTEIGHEQYTPTERSVILGTADRFEKNPIFNRAVFEGDTDYREKYFESLPKEISEKIKQGVYDELAFRDSKLNRITNAPIEAIKEGVKEMGEVGEGLMNPVKSFAETNGKTTGEKIAGVALKPIEKLIKGVFGIAGATPVGAGFYSVTAAIEENAPDAAKVVNNAIMPLTTNIDPAAPSYKQSLAAIGDAVWGAILFGGIHKGLKKEVTPEIAKEAAEKITAKTPEQIAEIADAVRVPETVPEVLKKQDLQNDLANPDLPPSVSEVINNKIVETSKIIEEKKAEAVTNHAVEEISEAPKRVIEQEIAELEKSKEGKSESTVQAIDESIKAKREILNPPKSETPEIVPEEIKAEQPKPEINEKEIQKGEGLLEQTPEESKPVEPVSSEALTEGKKSADKIAVENGFKNKSELLGKFKKENPERVAEIEKEKGREIHAQDLSKAELESISKPKPEVVSETKPFPKAERIKQLETAIAEIDAERIAEKNDKIRDFTYRDYKSEIEKLKKKEETFLAGQETAKRSDLYKVSGNPFAKFEIVEKLEATKEEIELGEQPVKIKNIKSGEIETVLESDLKKVEPKKVSEKDLKEKFTSPVVQTGGISFPIDVEPPRNIIQKHLTKEGNLPKEVFKDWADTQGKINSQLEQIRFTQKDFNSAVKKAYGKTALGTPKVTKAQIETINDVLSSNLKDIDTLPEPIQKIVTDMRHQIDALSKELQRSGILTESGIVKVDENLGFYLTRSYRLHSDKSWNWNTIPDEVKIKAAQLILKENPLKSIEQVEGLLKSFVNNRDIAWDMTSQGKTLGSKDLGILKKRKDIPIEIREFLGEYKDPFYNYSTSVSKMANLIERHKFLESVKRRGEDTWLFDEPTGDFNVKIAAEGNKTLEPLNGLYTTKELAKAFKEFQNPEKVPNYLRLYLIGNTVVKYSKTILSPITHARNFTSNFMLQAANGRIDFSAGAKTAQTIKNKIINLDDATFREYYKELAEKRVIDQSLQANELKADLQDAMKYMDDFEKYGDNFIKKLRNKPLKAVEKAYLLEDNIHKIYAYEAEKNRYKYLGEEDAKTKAAEIVRLTMPTYSEVPLAIRNLRRFPLTGTFVTFPYEILRTSYNTAELAVKELKQPETRAIGAQRLLGFMTAATVTGTLSTLTRSKNGMDKNDESDMRRFFAPWTVNSDILFLDNKGSGVYTYMDLGYSDPYNYLKKPANAILKGHRDQDLIDAAYQFAQPFIGEELLAGKLMDLARNKKASSGGQVYNPELPRGEKWGKITAYLFEAVEPGAISSAKRISDAFDKSVNDYGGTSDPKNEIIGVVTGQRINTLDVGKSYRFRTFNTGKRLNQAVNIYNTKRYDKDASDKDKQDAYVEAQKAVDEIVKEAAQDYAAAIRLGAPKDKVDDSLDGMYLEKFKASSDVKNAIKMGVPLYIDDEGKLKRKK